MNRCISRFILLLLISALPATGYSQDKSPANHWAVRIQGTALELRNYYLEFADYPPDELRYGIIIPDDHEPVVQSILKDPIVDIEGMNQAATFLRSPDEMVRTAALLYLAHMTIQPTGQVRELVADVALNLPTQAEQLLVRLIIHEPITVVRQGQGWK